MTLWKAVVLGVIVALWPTVLSAADTESEFMELKTSVAVCDHEVRRLNPYGKPHPEPRSPSTAVALSLPKGGCCAANGSALGVLRSPGPGFNGWHGGHTHGLAGSAARLARHRAFPGVSTLTQRGPGRHRKRPYFSVEPTLQGRPKLPLSRPPALVVVPPG